MAQTVRRDIVTIGASSGGLEPLMNIVGGLPRDFAASVFVVVHVPAHARSELPAILSRAGTLPATHPRDNESIEQGHIYVAPPDFHLVLNRGRLRVVRGPRENNHRPAVDPLFRSAAQFYGPRAIGIVLSGALDDGAAGLFAIKSRGGIAIVQDPADAVFPEMPVNALRATQVDYSAPRDRLAELIIKLIGTTSIEAGATMDDDGRLKKESDIVVMDKSAMEDEKPGTPSVYGCPDCGGTLWELQDGEWLRFRCRVGHAFSADGLLNSQTISVESALWNAYRALHENAALARRVAKRARDNNQSGLAEKFEQRSRQGDQEAELIHKLLLMGTPRAPRSHLQMSKLKKWRRITEADGRG